VLVYFTRENNTNTAIILNKEDGSDREFKDSVAAGLPVLIGNLPDSVFIGRYVLPVVFMSENDDDLQRNILVYADNLRYLFDDLTKLRGVTILWPFYITEESVRHRKS